MKNDKHKKKQINIKQNKLEQSVHIYDDDNWEVTQILGVVMITGCIHSYEADSKSVYIVELYIDYCPYKKKYNLKVSCAKLLFYVQTSDLNTK